MLADRHVADTAPFRASQTCLPRNSGDRQSSDGMTATVRFLAESKVAVKSRQNRKNFTLKCGEYASIGGEETALADAKQAGGGSASMTAVAEEDRAHQDARGGTEESGGLPNRNPPRDRDFESPQPRIDCRSARNGNLVVSGD